MQSPSARAPQLVPKRMHLGRRAPAAAGGAPTPQERWVKVILAHQGRMRILRANLVGHLERLAKPGDIDPVIGSRILQCSEHVLRCNVPDEIVSRKGAAAKPG